MTSIFKTLTVALLLLYPFSMDAQNYLMPDKHSSYHAGVQIAYNTFENYYALLPGYTYHGRLTAGVDLGKTTDKVNGINSTVLRPNLSFLIIKQGDQGLPFGLNIAFGYQFNYLLDLNADAQSFQFGIGLYHEIAPLNNVRIIPALLIEGNKPTTGINPQFEESVLFSYGLQTSIVWNNYYITPRYVLFDGVNTLGVQLGMLFSAFEFQD